MADIIMAKLGQGGLVSLEPRGEARTSRILPALNPWENPEVPGVQCLIPLILLQSWLWRVSPPL